MACPFSGATASPGKGSGCPFARQWEQQQETHHQPQAPLDASDVAPSAASAAAANPPAPAVCPYGFGSGAGARGSRQLGELSCVLCSSLMHQASVAHSCGHKFCAACITGAKDCPVCGRDIESLAAATETQELVDTYLSGHSRSSSMVEAQQAALEGAAVGVGGAAASMLDSSPSSLFLFHGLRSLLGGNTDAALHRLARCRDLLLDDLQRSQHPAGAGRAATVDPAPPSPRDVACQLGAVCGSLGDCWRRKGDLAAAQEELARSAAYLRPYASADAEAAHALSVTLSKLGDMEYYKEQQRQQQRDVDQQLGRMSGLGIAEEGGAASGATAAGARASGGGGEGRRGASAAAAAALPLYEEALVHRRALCGPLSGGQAGAPATLDLVSAVVKVADTHETMGDVSMAQRCWHQAAAELHELKLQVGDTLDHGPAAKMHALEDLIELRGGHGRT